MPITSKEIAEICGVSRGTVDRALNNRSGVSEKTKNKILKVISEHNYQPNYIGRSLVKGKSLSIGVIVFDLNNRVFAEIINGIESRARELEYFVNLSISFRDPKLEMEIIRQHTARNVDGIIMLSVNRGEQFLQFIKQLNKPIVTIGNRISSETPYVWIDDTQAIKDLVKLHASKGYKHIIYVSPPLRRLGQENLYVPEQRYLAFKQSIEEHDMTYHAILHSEYIEEILKSDFKSKKTAVLCSSDIYAIDILNTFKNANIRVPEDIGVAGFDNIDILKYISPKLTTIGFNSENIGVEAVNCLMKQIDENEVPITQLLKHFIVEGETL